MQNKQQPSRPTSLPRKEVAANSTLSENERFRGIVRLNALREQVSRGEIGKAYLWKEKLMTAVQDKVLELAPQGSSSQQDFVEVVQKAIEAVTRDSKEWVSGEAEAADIDLTLGMIEKTLLMIPYQVFFQAVEKSTDQR